MKSRTQLAQSACVAILANPSRDIQQSVAYEALPSDRGSRALLCQTCRSMGRLSCLFLFTLAAIMASAAPAVARVTTGDAAATHAYLEARIVLQRAEVALEPAELKAIGVLEARVKAECPGVLTGAPPHVKGEKTNESQYQVSEELLNAGFGAGGDIEHPVDARFASTVRRLRWSNPKLTRLLRSLALEQAKQSAIPPPELCADMKFWVASGYTAVSPGTKQYLQRLRVVSSITLIESEPHEPVTDIFNLDALVAHRLMPYENHADRLLARKAIRPEANLTNPALRPLLEAAGKIFVALGRTAAPSA